MWCRTILTAVAISYVICMLLLSGLQKDDLDANTLEKLGRHNVNIDDMNNEKQRQTCLLDSSLNSAKDNQKEVASKQSTENYKALGLSATNNSVEIIEYPKKEMHVVENLEYKTALLGKTENNQTENFANERQTTLNKISKTNDLINNSDNIENLTKIEEHNGLQIEYLQSQPDLESVMNFWTKLTHYTKTVVTKIPTTPASPNVSEKNNITTVTVETTNNNGYVHSREMEFISRLLAEYLASQNVPSTTQKISAKNAYINFISRKNEKTTENPQVRETNPIFPAKFISQPLNDRFNRMNNQTQFEVQPRENINYNYMPYETSSIPFKVSYGSNYNQQIRNVQDPPYNQIFTVDTKTVVSPKNNPIRFLDNLLRSKNEYFNDGISLEYEATTKGIKLINVENLTSESFNLPILIKYLKESNDSNWQNFNRNQNRMMNDNKFKNTPIEANSWEPIRNNRMINQELNVIPIGKTNINQNTETNNLRIRKNWEQGENVDMSQQYKAGPSDITRPERMNRLESSRSLDDAPNYINKSDQIQNFNLNNDRFKVIPAELKKSKHDRNFDTQNSVFKSMLPSIKQSKRNQNFRLTNNQSINQTESNKLEQVQNLGIYDDNIEAVVTEKNRNQIAKMNNEQFNNPRIADTWTLEATKTLEQNSKTLDDNQFNNVNMPAIVKKYESIRGFQNQLKNIPTNINNSDGNKNYVMNNDAVAIPIDVKDLKPIQNSEMNFNEPQAIPENIIREIAEKVKQIVLKDIGKGVITTTLNLSPPTSSTTTTTSTAVPTTTTAVPTTATTSTMKPTVTTTETPSTAPKEMTEANQVIQKLMEIFKEFKEMKESAKTSTQIAKNTTIPLQDTTLNYRTTTSPKFLMQTYPLGQPTFNSEPRTKNTPLEVSPYGPNMVPISGVNLPENLVIQNPASQNIVPKKVSPKKLVPKNLVQQYQPPQNQAPWYIPINFNNPRNDYHSGAIIQTNSDEIAPLAIQISKPMRLINQHILVTTKSPAEKLKVVQERESKKRLEQKYGGLANVKNHRDKLTTDFSKKVRFADNLKMHEFNDRHSYKSGLNKVREKPRYIHGYSSNFQHIENFEPLSGSRYPENSNYPTNLSHMESISHQRGYGQTSSYPGAVSKSEVLSHTTGFNHPHRNGNTQGKVNNWDEIRYHSGSYGYKEQDRQHPHYDTSKFHERLERIENWPQSSWKEHRYVTTENCCDEIPPREQVPLTKVKQRTRFDDSHFSNFLKSQQKVTDMLEKILTNNMKNSGARSVETP